MKQLATTERASRGAATAKRILVITATAALLAACQQERRAARTAMSGEPAVQATVLTIRTTIQPENKTFVHSVVIANDRARSGDEVDRWRLYDFHDNVVTSVDDLGHTYRRQPFSTVLADLESAISQPLITGIPRATLVKTGAHRVIQGADAAEYQVRAGSYVRQLWIANHPLIPSKLFAMMTASQPSRSPLLPMMRNVTDALLAIDGFPLDDHAELGFDSNKKLVVDNTVVKIERRNVPQSWLNVSASYRDVTPPPPAPRQKRK